MGKNITLSKLLLQCSAHESLLRCAATNRRPREANIFHALFMVSGSSNTINF